MASDELEVRGYRPTSELYGQTCSSVFQFLEKGRNDMASETFAQVYAKRQSFLEMLNYPEFHEMKNQDQADALEITVMTLLKWKKMVPDDYLASALKLQRERHAKRSLETDSSLMKEVRKGNVKAIELFYRRIEGWEPKQAMELSRGKDKELEGKSNLELARMIVADLSEEDRKQLMEPPALP